MYCMNGTSPRQIPVYILTSLANKYPCILVSLYYPPIPAAFSGWEKARRWRTTTSSSPSWRASSTAPLTEKSWSQTARATRRTHECRAWVSPLKVLPWMFWVSNRCWGRKSGCEAGLWGFDVDVCTFGFYVCEVIGFVDWLDKGKSFEKCSCLRPEFDCSEVTQCGWQDIKLQLLTN